MQDKVLSPEKTEEAKLKARYPHLGSKPGGSDLLRKRLQKGVGFIFRHAELVNSLFIIFFFFKQKKPLTIYYCWIVYPFLHVNQHLLFSTAKVLWLWRLQHGQGQNEKQTAPGSSDGESRDHWRSHPDSPGSAPKEDLAGGQQTGCLIWTFRGLSCYHSCCSDLCSNLCLSFSSSCFLLFFCVLFLSWPPISCVIALKRKEEKKVCCSALLFTCSCVETRHLGCRSRFFYSQVWMHCHRTKTFFFFGFY